MAIHKLTDLKIKARIKEITELAFDPYKAKNAMLGDGECLFLAVAKTGTANWQFRYMDNGKMKAVGLGGYPTVSLQTARELAQELRDARASGLDPQRAKREKQARRVLDQNREKTFQDCAEDYIALTKPSWKNEKHGQQWKNTLAQYVYPVIGHLPVAHVTTDDVLRILKPIWVSKAETAGRLRGRIESVLDWATAHNRRTGDNPARLKGHLEYMLPRLRKEVEHHASMPYADVPQFLVALNQQSGMARYALEFLILCAARTGEVVGATWSEIDLDKRLWTIPAKRMKAGVTHRVPLSGRALEILRVAKGFANGIYVFPGGKKDKPLSNMALLMLLRRMELKDITTHGFRSSFRVWAGHEKPEYPSEVCERCLAHGLKSDVEAAYLRTDFLDQRVALMSDWATHCLSAQQPAPTPVAANDEPLATFSEP